MIAIEARDAMRSFGAATVVAGVSLSVAAGEWVALVGPSGCGKTTLLQMLGLLDRPTGGTILVDGEDGWAHPPGWRASTRLHRIGFVFQDHSLLEHLTARDNVALPAWCAGRSRRTANARAGELLDKLGLAGCADRRAHSLSGGEAQRVAIARALVNRPAVLLADEPTGNLDSAAAATVLEALADAVAGGTGLLVVTHDDHVAKRAHRVVTMRDGRV